MYCQPVQVTNRFGWFYSFNLLYFQPSPVNNHGILLWSKHGKLRLCNCMQGLCCQWLILLGLSFQKLYNKFQCSPENCSHPSWRRLRLVFLSTAVSPSQAWWRTGSNTDAQTAKKLSAELAPAHGKYPLENNHAWDHCCSAWMLLCTSSNLLCLAELFHSSETHRTDDAVALLVSCFSIAWFYSRCLNRSDFLAGLVHQLV